MRNLQSTAPYGVAVSLGALFMLSGCGGQPRGGMPNFPQAVTVVTLKTQPVTLTRELPGRTSAYLVAEVRPQVSGLIKQRLFTEGGFVKAGQPLYEIDDSVYRAQENSARAALQKAEATAEAAQLSAKRTADLVKIDAVSTQDNENAVAALGQAKADVASAQAAVDSAAINVGYAHIVSPISGRIGKSNVTQGALVTADQATALSTVQQLDPLYIDVNEASSQWLQLQQEISAGRVQGGSNDTPARILLENGTTYEHEGKLQFTDVTVDPTTGDFLLRVLVPNPNHVLMPGMFVRAVLDEGVVQQGVLVPQLGIQRDPKGNATALVVNKDNKVEQRDVTVSRAIGDQWLVDAGLTAGDRVIIEGVQKAMPGASVQATEAASAAPASAPSAAGPAAAGN